MCCSPPTAVPPRSRSISLACARLLATCARGVKAIRERERTRPLRTPWSCGALRSSLARVLSLIAVAFLVLLIFSFFLIYFLFSFSSYQQEHSQLRRIHFFSGFPKKISIYLWGPMFFATGCAGQLGRLAQAGW